MPRPLMRPWVLLASTLSLAPLAVEAGPSIELSATASRPALNDRFYAQLYIETSAPDAAEVANRLNRELGEALRIAKQATQITVRSGQQQAYPLFNREQKIESWRMRGELQLEASDAGALSTAVTQLQQMRVALAGISQQPAPATRRLAEEAATEDAIRAFEARAGQIARTLGKPYRIKRLHISQETPPMLLQQAVGVMRAKAASPMPLEASDSLISVSIQGEIELAD